MNRFARRSLQFAILALLALPVRVISAGTTIDWRPVSSSDLVLKDNPKEPGANAMVLYRASVIDARAATTAGDAVQNYMEIKIFTKAGTQEGHVVIPYDKSFESVPYVAGRTILPDGTIEEFKGQVLDTTLVNGAGFKIFAKTFTLPDVRPGCVIEYKYARQADPQYVHNEEWVLSSNLYTREAHFAYYPYEGAGGMGLTPLASTYLLPASAKLTRQIDGSYKLSVTDVPAVVDEPLMPPKTVIEPRVEFFYLSPGEPDPTESQNKYWNFWAKKWDGEMDHFIGKKSALDQELAKICSPNDSPETKLRKIYARVEKIRNLSMEHRKTQAEDKAENLKPDNSVADVLKRGYAYGHQINLTFIGLARAAGFQATEVYIAPRNSSIFLPKRNEVNEIRYDDIVWVKAGDKEYYLDPGSRYYPFGILPWYESETGGVRVDNHTATVVNTATPNFSDAAIKRSADLFVKPDGSVSGTVQVDFTGLQGGMEREQDHRADSTGRAKALEAKIKAWLPAGSNFQITKMSGWDDIEKPLHVEGTLTLASYSTTTGRNMLLPLDPFHATQAGDFLKQTRHNAVYFPYPYEEIDEVTVHAPAGYKIDALPKQQKYDLGAAFYQIIPTEQGNTVQVSRTLAIKGILFPENAYASFRALFGAVQSNDDAQMVLENTQTGQLN